MRTFTIALASALLLAYITTEMTARLWPDNSIALFTLAAVLLFVNGLFNARLATTTSKPVGADARPEREARTGDRGKPANRSKPNRAAGPRKPAEAKQQRPAPQAANQAAAAGGAQAGSGASADAQREPGTVKWYNRTKGYGFIVRANGEEIFVHQRSIIGNSDGQRGALRDGQAVTFSVSEHEKGTQAENVAPAD